MKVALLYVNAGKGHYIPAKALSDSFSSIGTETILIDGFKPFKCRIWPFFIKKSWDLMLKYPSLERLVDRSVDVRFNYYNIRKEEYLFARHRNFRRWFYQNKPDLIVCTHFVPALLVPLALRRMKEKCPVYYYDPDVFDIEVTAFNKELQRVFIPSGLGKANAIKQGDSPEHISICPFPIRREFEVAKRLTKKEARAKLSLKDKFTILISAGGEGIFDLSLLYRLAESSLDIQCIVIGGKNVEMERRMNSFVSEYPAFSLVRAGYVDNVYDYLMACDLQVGKTGANAMMEAFYMHVPCLISEVLYMARSTQSFFDSYPVGWCENNVDRQLEIIKGLYENLDRLIEIEQVFSSLPLSFGSDGLRDMIIKDYQEFLE